jgi:1,2-diacylglycerol 3-alpha-glucosyltransferase
VRILMISDVFFPRVNGVSTSVETFRGQFAEQGVETTLLAPAYAGEHDEPGIIRLPARRLPLDPEDRLMSYRATLALAPRLATEGYDLVHIQTPFVAHYAGVKLARRLDIPVVTTYHTLFEEYLHHYVPFLPREWMRGIARRYSRQQCNEVDTVIVPSSAMRDRLQEYGVGAPMEILPTGIPINRFADGDRLLFRMRHGIPFDRPVALYVGRVAHEKNISFLIDALAVACRRVPRLLLVVTGEGPAMDSLERRARELGVSDNLMFLGYLDRKCELPSAYAGADLFVFSSRTETQGLVLLEAMAAGLPVLALACMGTRDIIEPQRGAVVGCDDHRTFGDQLAELILDPQRRAEMAPAARAFAEEWSDVALARRLAGVYTRLRNPAASAQPHPQPVLE